MGKKSKRISLDGDRQKLESNPFSELEGKGFPDRSKETKQPDSPRKVQAPGKSRGRVDVVRQRSAGSGGWMTVAKNFVGISIEEKKSLKKTIQKRCGVGGTLKDGKIEIQGDKREQVREVLESAGFSVVFAGG